MNTQITASYVELVHSICTHFKICDIPNSIFSFKKIPFNSPLNQKVSKEAMDVRLFNVKPPKLVGLTNRIHIIYSKFYIPNTQILLLITFM